MNLDLTGRLALVSGSTAGSGTTPASVSPMAAGRCACVTARTSDRAA